MPDKWFEPEPAVREEAPDVAIDADRIPYRILQSVYLNEPDGVDESVTIEVAFYESMVTADPDAVGVHEISSMRQFMTDYPGHDAYGPTWVIDYAQSRLPNNPLLSGNPTMITFHRMGDE
jgi:hypothetical protein